MPAAAGQSGRSERGGVARLLDDPAVTTALSGCRVVEFQGCTPGLGGEALAVLRWRRDHLTARREGRRCATDGQALPGGSFDAAVVHLQKSRDAWQADCVEAWRLVRQGGRILLVGGNELGIRSAVRRFATETGTEGEVLVNRARARVVGFTRHAAPGPEPVHEPAVTVPIGAGRSLLLRSAHWN